MTSKGESYRTILRYWFPELVTSTLIFTLPVLLDLYLISLLDSRSTLGALGNANDILFLITKLSEGIAVAAITVIGTYNGSKEYDKAGAALGDVFWTTIILGLIPCLILLAFPTQILLFLNTPQPMASIGAPYLQLRAFGVFLSFLYLAFFGFMRGVKNTKTPMLIYIIGTLLFIIVDLLLIHGSCGLPACGLIGSGIATIAQYGLMVILCIIHLMRTPEYKQYFRVAFFRMFNPQGAWKIVNLSWPIMIDKAALAYAFVYLRSLINPLGKNAIVSFTLIKQLEQVAILPGIAFATVLTFLVSNSLGAHDLASARSNIRKILTLTGLFVLVLVAAMCINPGFFLSLFDVRNKFAPFAIAVFPAISLFALLDFMQIIYASALRGAGDVMSVMIIRVLCCTMFFYPVSILFSWIQLADPHHQFILIYSSIYLTTGLMGLLFYLRLRGKKWHQTLHLNKSSSPKPPAHPPHKVTNFSSGERKAIHAQNISKH